MNQHCETSEWEQAYLNELGREIRVMSDGAIQLLAEMVLDEIHKRETVAVREEAKPQAGATQSVDIDPEIRAKMPRFFSKELFGMVRKKPKNADVENTPAACLLLKIRELTTDWDPSRKCSVRKWSHLFLALDTMHLINQAKRKKYREFVEVVIRFCFSDVADRYRDNMSKCHIYELPSDWTEEERKLSSRLRKELQSVISTSAK